MPDYSKNPLRLEWVDPKTLAANPKNWRTHSAEQISALGETLTQVGWAGACLYNSRTQRLVDGHARVKVALAQGAAAVPVLVGDWDEAEEAKILLTLDPLAAMAGVDGDALKSLMADVGLAGDGLAGLIASLDAAVFANTIPPEAAGREYDESVAAEVKMCKCPKCNHEFPA